MNDKLSLVFLLPIFLLCACSDNQATTETSIEQIKPLSKTEAVHLTDEPCAFNQVTISEDAVYTPGFKCRHVTRNMDSERFLQRYIQQCQQQTGAEIPPVAAARVQVTACKTAEDQSGSIASKRICCDLPQSETILQPVKPKIIAYRAELDCPENHLQALATQLHYPQKRCETNNRKNSKLNIGSHAKKACQRAVGHQNYREKVLDSTLFSCQEDGSEGSYVDVAVCCSATILNGKRMHPLNRPVNLWEALRLGDQFALALLLSREPQRASEKGEQGILPLHRAGTVTVAKMLLNKGANVNGTDDHGSTPLHEAVIKRQGELAAFLLKKGADVNAVTQYGAAPLNYAQSLETAKLLVTNGANPHGVVNAQYPLHSAAIKGQVAIVEWLLAQGVDVDRVSEYGNITALQAVASARNRDYVNLFGEKISSAEVIKLLMDAGADINALTMTRHPKTALDLAQDPIIQNLLRTYGALSASELAMVSPLPAAD